jgi:7,8-dihydroneopterin aldolase/epimerase/oxygenase
MNTWFEHPALRDCRKLFLRNYLLHMLLGVYEHERLQPQRVRMNVELYVPLALSTPKADALSAVVDYEFIRQRIAQCVARGHIQLQETLCDEVLALMLAHPQVRAARVGSEKLDAYPDCESVGCEVFGMNF